MWKSITRAAFVFVILGSVLCLLAIAQLPDGVQ